MEGHAELQMKILQMQQDQRFLQELLTNKATIRDQFALAALQGMLARGLVNVAHFAEKRGITCADYYATAAYEYADAMLRSREGREG